MDAQMVGDKIAKLRKARNMTQQQLADELSVTNKAVSKWETGAGLPDIAMLPTLASVLGVSVDDIISTSSDSVNENSDNPSGRKNSFRRYIKNPVVVALVTSVIVLAVITVSILYYSNKRWNSFTEEFFTNAASVRLYPTDDQSQILRLQDSTMGITDEHAKKIYEIQLGAQIRTEILSWRIEQLQDCKVIVYLGDDLPSRESTASVLLTLGSEDLLSHQMVRGVAEVLRSNIPAIEYGNMTIVDNNLNYYPVDVERADTEINAD